MSKIPNVEVRFMSSRIAHEQALFSSGDRTVSTVIERAATLGGDLGKALRETGIDAAFHTSRDRSYEEIAALVDSRFRPVVRFSQDRTRKSASLTFKPAVSGS